MIIETEKKTATIVVRMTNTLKLALAKEADKQGLNVSQFLRHVLNKKYGIA
jgi:predicted DNA binding CopG/RHH family protein